MRIDTAAVRSAFGHLRIEQPLTFRAAHQVAGDQDTDADQADDQARERIDIGAHAQLHLGKYHHRQRARARAGNEARDDQIIER